jgi:hypothetical protein
MNKLKLTGKCKKYLDADLIELLERPGLAKLLKEFDARITNVEHASIRSENTTTHQS